MKTYKVVILSLIGFSITLAASAYQSEFYLYLLGSVAYFLFGVFVPDAKGSAKFTFVLFAPYLIHVFIAWPTRLGNPALFPWFVPMVPILFYVSFLLGAFFISGYKKRNYRFSALMVLSLLLLLYLSIEVVLPPARSMGERRGERIRAAWERQEVDQMRATLNKIFKTDGSCYDFGEIGIKDSVVYKYKIYNAKPAALLIKKVNASCGCIISTYSQGPIPQNEFGEVSVVFKPVHTGPALNNIVVETNDINRPFLSFRLTGTVRSI